jgi:hypothetical protein
LALENWKTRWVPLPLRDSVGQKLQGDKPVQVDVLSLVHHTHAATAQLFDYAVVRDGLADHGFVKS